jgi:integrase
VDQRESRRAPKVPKARPRVRAQQVAAQGMRMRELAKQHGWDEGGGSPWQHLLFRRTQEPGRRGPFGAPWAPDTIGDEFEKACKRAGWPTTRTPHHARHYVAGNLLRAGFSTKAAAAILGHRTVRTFEETYAHVLREIGYGKRISAALSSLE